MKIECGFKNIKETKHLTKFIEEKSTKLNKFFKGDAHLIWEMKQNNDGIIGSCRVIRKNYDHSFSSSNHEPHGLINEIIKKASRSIKEHKDQVKNKDSVNLDYWEDGDWQDANDIKF